MRIRLSGGDLGASTADVVACFACEGDAEPRALRAGVLRRRLAERMQAERFRGKRGESLLVSPDGRGAASRLVVVGLGKPAALTADAVRLGCARAARIAGMHNAGSIALALPQIDERGTADEVQAAVEGALFGAYRFDRYLTDPARKCARVESIELVCRGPKRELAAAIRRGEIVGQARSLARDLVNEAPSVMNPRELARRAAADARAAGLRVKALDAAALKKLGMGALLAVGRGSVHPPQVVHLTYSPKGRKPSARIVLVGKGVTFDSGGLDVKTSAGMANMKGDMSGAAAVLAAMTALPELGCRAEVHGLLGLVENMIGQASYKPGDILQTLSGKTVEVTNTDAEGRLVLCDLLAYAAKQLKPDAMVDLATLTGACVIALGRVASGVFSRHDELRAAVLDAGRDAGEKLWPMPMFEEYLESLLDGPADLRNSGDRYGGAGIAALFLGEFVPRKLPWVHLDICGPAFLEKASPEAIPGGTGAGVATLLRWLERV